MSNQTGQRNLREALIQTTLDIISTQGLEQVSMRKLGERLGVSRTAAYKHFADKNALLCAITEEGYKKLKAQFDVILNDTTIPPMKRVSAVGIAYVEFATENPVHYRLMFGNEIAESERSENVAQLTEEVFNVLLSTILDCQKQDLIRPVDPYIIANTLWSLTHGISTLVNDGQIHTANAFKGLPAFAPTGISSEKADIRQVFDDFADIMLYGFSNTNR